MLRSNLSVLTGGYRDRGNSFGVDFGSALGLGFRFGLGFHLGLGFGLDLGCGYGLAQLTRARKPTDLFIDRVA